VRACEGGEIVLTTYGRSSGFCVDPIEKKPLNHFSPVRDLLVRHRGCNLSCKFCRTGHEQVPRDGHARRRATPEDIARAAQRLGCRSVAYTYNDPVIFLEYAIDTAKACHAVGIKSVAVTAGYISPGAREDFFAHMDAANVDLKAFSDDSPPSVRWPPAARAGYAHLPQARDERVVRAHDPPHSGRERFRRRDRADDPVGGGGARTRRPMHFTAFHPDWKMMDHPPTPPRTLGRARAIALRNGVHYAYTATCTTPRVAAPMPWLRQPRDPARLVRAGEWALDAKGCCTSACADRRRVDAAPGTWGARRVPVRMRINLSL